jgi:hypothetical protein
VEKKHIALIWLAVLAIAAAVAYPWARWGMFCMKATETVQKLDRFATADQVLALPAALRADAQHYHLDPAALKIELVLEERDMMGALTFWFVVAKISDGSRTFKAEDRIETSIDDDFAGRLRDGGLTVEKLRKASAPVTAPITGE